MKKFLLPIFLLLCCFNLYSKNKGNIVRIAAFENDALYKMRGNDGASSYAVEFMNMINRYSDYQFEYISIERDFMADALRKKIVDVVPFMGLGADTNKEFLISETPSAVGATVLASNHMPDMENLRIGIRSFAPESLRQKILSYTESQGINASLYYFDNSEDMYSALYGGKIDAFATIDLDLNDEFFVIASVESTFFYLSCSKDNRQLFENLKDTMSTLFMLNPAFISNLRINYIPAAKYSINGFTPKEAAYIRDHRDLKIAVVTDRFPYCYWQKNKIKGIIIDQIEEISRFSGFKINFLMAKSYCEAMENVKNGKADLIYGVSDKLIQYDLDYIRPSVEIVSQKMLLISKNEDLKEKGGTFINVKGLQYDREIIDKKVNVISTIHVDSSQEAFTLLESSDTYFTVMPALTLDFYLKNHLITGIKNLDELYTNNISLGVSKKLPPELMGVLDKSIYTISASLIDHLMEMNIQATPTLVSVIKKHFFLFTLLSLALILLVFTALFLFIIVETKRRKDFQINQAMNLANRDSMTGLLNHIAFKKKVSKVLTYQAEKEIGVFIMIDIDNFKQVNDTLGHAKGDYVIVSVANILLSSFKGRDIKGRMGGDEFAVYMTDVTNLESVKKKMLHLQQSIKEFFEHEKISIKVTCSLGGSWCLGPQQEDAFDLIYKSADNALYQVKKGGKDSFLLLGLNSY